MNHTNRDKIIIVTVLMGKRLINFTHAFHAPIPLVQSSVNETENERKHFRVRFNIYIFHINIL